ncbi:MAG: TonB-dependent receptor [Candidatus Poribacteria bacterium]|nr:TonB-dependent receptor [Candidatus Poribacteria bacterium]
MHRFAILFLAALSSVAAAQDLFDTDLSLEALLKTPINAASKYDQTSKDAPASVTIITSDEIERFGYETLGEILASTRGFYYSDDRNYGYVGVRGFSRPTDYNNRILLLLNGQSMNEGVYGSAFVGRAFSLDTSIIKRIEIVRGPGSALYGGHAMFAVVNIVTKSGQDLDGIGLGAQGGSFGLTRGAVRIGDVIASDTDLIVSAHRGEQDGDDLYYEVYDDPATNNGIAEALDWEQDRGAFLRAQYQRWSFQSFFSSRRKGVPTASYESTFGDPDLYAFDELASVQLRYESEVTSNMRVMARGYGHRYAYVSEYPYDDVPDYIEGTIDNWFGGEAQLNWDVIQRNRLTAGVEYANHLRADYRAWPEGSDEYYFDGDFPFSTYGIYLQDEQHITKYASARLGLRYDRRDIDDSMSPRVALLLFPANHTTLKILYGEAFRAPNIYEKYYEEAGAFKPNPTLKPEEVRTAEALIEQQIGGNWFVTGGAYHYKVSRLVDTITHLDGEEQYVNVGPVEANGLEVEATVRLDSGVMAAAAYTWQKATSEDSGDRLTNSPEHVLIARLMVPVLKWGHAAVQSRYESERITVYESVTEPFFLTDVTLTTRRFAGIARASLKVRNVFDESYATPGGFEHLQDAITQDGRTVELKLDARF